MFVSKVTSGGVVSPAGEFLFDRQKGPKNRLRAAALRTRFYDIDCKCIYQ